MNIVLVVIDTLRYDHVGTNGNAWIRTPNLDRLAADAWLFDRAFAASFPTIPHRTDLITGQYGEPFHIWRPLPFEALALPRILGEAGYATQLIHDTPHLVNGGHNFDFPFHAWTQIRGAEVDRPWIDDREGEFPENWKPDPLFDEAAAAGPAAVRGPTPFLYSRANRGRKRDEDWNAAKLFTTAQRFLRENARRDHFFLWVDSFDPHEPWDSPPEFVRLYDRTPGYDGTIDPRGFVVKHVAGPDDPIARRLAAWYAAKVTWVDHWLGRMLDALDETGLSRNTAVILTADHGTRLGEGGRISKQYPLWEPEGHVPLMVRVPGAGTGRSGMLVQPQDIFATVLGIAGAALPGGRDGQDVLGVARQGQATRREVALAGRHVSAWRAESEAGLFTAFDEHGYLVFTLKAADSQWRVYGSPEDVAAREPRTVERMRALALEELQRRGLHPAVLNWLRSEGAAPFPRELERPPLPAGYCHYWDRAYSRW